MAGGDTSAAAQMAEELGLNYPVLVDPGYEVFQRWDESYVTPSSTFFSPGMVVEAIDTTWTPTYIEELLYE